MRGASKTVRQKHLQGYIERIVDSDFKQIDGSIRKPETLKRWIRAYAAALSTSTSYEKIRDAAAGKQGSTPVKKTAQTYRENLRQLFLINSTPSWSPKTNKLKRLTGKDKHQLVEPAFATELLGMSTELLLQGQKPDIDASYGGRWLGRLFESLVSQSVKVYAQAAQANVSHLRTKGGRHEVGLIIERRDERVLAFEVKTSKQVTSNDTKHLRWLKSEIGDRVIDTAVINTGSMAYRRDKDQVAVIPAALLGP